MKQEYIIFEAYAYKQLIDDVNSIKTEMVKLRESLGGKLNSGDEWLSPLEVMQLLGIKRTKYFQMKSQGVFKFSQFGRKSKISRKSLESFLKQNIISQ